MTYDLYIYIYIYNSKSLYVGQSLYFSSKLPSSGTYKYIYIYLSIYTVTCDLHIYIYLSIYIYWDMRSIDNGGTICKHLSFLVSDEIVEMKLFHHNRCMAKILIMIKM